MKKNYPIIYFLCIPIYQESLICILIGAEPVSLTIHSALRILITELSIGASHQVSVHLAKQLQRKRFLEIDQSEKRMACGGHVC